MVRLLAFDCSFHSAGLALLDLEKLSLLNPKIENKKKPTQFLQEFHYKTFSFPVKELKKSGALIEKTWDSSSGPHSDQLILKIAQAFSFKKKHSILKQEEISLQLKKHLVALAVGTGPGRFTGIRTALSVAKSLAYTLKVPVCPVDSLQLLAESFFEEKTSLVSDKISSIYVSLQAFKNQVYHGEFTPLDQASVTSKTSTKLLKKNLTLDLSQTPTTLDEKKSLKTDIKKPFQESSNLLDFKDWEEKIINSSEKKIFCVSDLENFYKIKTPVLNKLHMQSPKIYPGRIIQLALNQGTWIQDWKKIQANYMRTNF